MDSSGHVTEEDWQNIKIGCRNQVLFFLSLCILGICVHIILQGLGPFWATVMAGYGGLVIGRCAEKHGLFDNGPWERP